MAQVLNIKIQLDNDAFQDGHGPTEIHSILITAARKLANNTDLTKCDFPLHDSNGNNVGYVEIDHE